MNIEVLLDPFEWNKEMIANYYDLLIHSEEDLYSSCIHILKKNSEFQNKDITGEYAQW